MAEVDEGGDAQQNEEAVLFYARALYEYQPVEDSEIGFQESGTKMVTFISPFSLRYSELLHKISQPQYSNTYSNYIITPQYYIIVYILETACITTTQCTRPSPPFF